MVAKSDMDHQLKNRLFYRIARLLRDSVRYLFDNPAVTYNQLLVVARKAEGEATKGKSATIAQRKAVMLDWDETPHELTELKRQIANLKLMVSKPMEIPKKKNRRSILNKW